MNKTLFLVLTGLAIPASYANCDSSTAASAADSKAAPRVTTADLKGTETAILKVKQIQCSNCAKKIQKALMSTDGVKMVQVNVEQKTVTVHYLAAKTKPENLIASLKQKTLYEGELL